MEIRSKAVSEGTEYLAPARTAVWWKVCHRHGWRIETHIKAIVRVSGENSSISRHAGRVAAKRKIRGFHRKELGRVCGRRDRSGFPRRRRLMHSNWSRRLAWPHWTWRSSPWNCRSARLLCRNGFASAHRYNETSATVDLTSSGAERLNPRNTTHFLRRVVHCDSHTHTDGSRAIL